MRTKTSLIAFALIACSAWSATSGAQTYPARPITLVVPGPPGGATDTLARALAEEMGKRLGQTIIVDNKPGGAGVIAVQAITRGAPDGYTMLLSHSAPLINTPHLYRNVQYDVRRDLSFVTELCVGIAWGTAQSRADDKATWQRPASANPHPSVPRGMHVLPAPWRAQGRTAAMPAVLPGRYRRAGASAIQSRQQLTVAAPGLDALAPASQRSRLHGLAQAYLSRRSDAPHASQPSVATRQPAHHAALAAVAPGIAAQRGARGCARTAAGAADRGAPAALHRAAGTGRLRQDRAAERLAP
ncbi:tripartite tricarboxylate transporter substrate binding protein [Cupriavidus sp. amp6]|uniref:Bug family tripartite tricarboxylate transporter substrate binding protein n=1 Tax=Cupriavidus sp. amp6 TaxID=388051 RepID=UPI0004161D65|nr:tripartite tricarboxylate transporter substrate-binding protein [Cupriavidus sp. amp6]